MKGVPSPQTFIAEIAPTAIELYKRYRISAALQIAQACLESGYGEHAPGNNLFGVKAYGWAGPVVRVATQEFVQGRWTEVEDSFRAYASFAESLRDHVEMLALSERYRNLIDARWDVAARLIKADGYATDPAYPSKLIAIIEQYKLYQYDGEGTHVLQLGSKGDDVRQLQHQLNVVLGTNLAEDGVFGPGTEAAVRAFQQLKHLQVDGIAGPSTLNALETAYQAKAGSSTAGGHEQQSAGTSHAAELAAKVAQLLEQAQGILRQIQ